jgi:class 3 adenylate cyclase
MKTENLAIVFVDIAGFTPRTSAQTREENLRLLKRFEGTVRPLVRIYNGRVVKTIGDAFLLTFRSPTDALLCSTAIHDRLAESDAAIAPAERFIIRAAVNVGEVRIEGGDVFGEAVNIASRIEGKANAGEIYFSESAYLSMTKSEVPSQEVGYTELKGIPGKVRLYRVPHAGETGFPMKRDDAGPTTPSKLPFAGLGLDPVRGKLAGIPADTAINHARGAVMKSLEMTAQGVSWWMTEIRRSRAVQYGTAVLAILLIIFMVWVVKHKIKPKPLNPIQKIQRSLGF